MNLIDSLIQERWLKTPGIIEAFRKIKRADFLPARIGYAEGVAGGPEDMKDLAELNEALPIGFGQTISQPLVVAFMMELLEPKEGEKILDIGSGSGWTTALLAHIVSANYRGQTSVNLGKIVAVEVVPELKEFGERNVSKYSFVEKGTALFVCADGSKGYEKEAPYDKILASASVHPVRNIISNGARELPEAWKKQLKIGGRIVTPIGNSIWLFVKKSPSFAKATEGKETEFEETEYPGFVFVPLISRR